MDKGGLRIWLFSLWSVSQRGEVHDKFGLLLADVFLFNMNWWLFYVSNVKVNNLSTKFWIKYVKVIKIDP